MARVATPLVLVSLILLTLALYVPHLGAPWVYEDENWLRQAPQAAQSWRAPGRALTSQSYHLTWQIVGNEPLLFRAGNVILHLASGLLVYGIGRALISGPAAVVGAGVFLLHPLNSETVSYVSARPDLLSTVWILLATWIAVACATPWRWPLILGAVWLGALSKETGLLGVPLVALTLLIWRPAAVRRPAFMPAWVVLGAILGATWSSVRVWLEMNPHMGGSWYAWPDFLRLQVTAVWYLMSQLLTLQSFSIDHDILALGPRWTIVAVVLTVSTAILIGIAWRRHPLVAWGLAWMGLAVAPRVLFRTNDFLNEHQLYLALVGPSLLVGAAGPWLWRWCPLAADRAWWRELQEHWTSESHGGPYRTLKGLP